MLAATAAAVAALPLAVPGLAALDLVTGRHRLPRLRVYLFVCQYLVNDSVEILAAPLLWARAGLGTRLDSAASLRRHRALQWWSAELLARRADRLLGLGIEFDDESAGALEPGPVIVIGRHASPFDASLAGVVYGRIGYAVRGVIMAELLADPGFDLIYGRLGSVFVPRDDGPAARSAIDAMARSVERHDGDRAAVVIFPEGRLFRQTVRDRALDRLSGSDPDRAKRLAGLTNVLPPRPGGLRILLDAMPAADVVVLDHRGLDHVRSLADLVGVVPSPEPIRLRATRIPRAEIPDDPDDATDWLDDLWLDLDASLAEELGPVD
ncbi:MAG: 1-acyl-sn-glycerol-3-phosphate acyltransferase [Actinomycetota bacterium]